MKSWAWDRRSKFWNKFYITFNIPHFLKDWWMRAWWQLLHFRDNNATIKSYCSFSPEMIWIRMFFKGCLPQISHAVYCEELAKYLPYCTRHSAITSIYNITIYPYMWTELAFTLVWNLKPVWVHFTSHVNVI